MKIIYWQQNLQVEDEQNINEEQAKCNLFTKSYKNINYSKQEWQTEEQKIADSTKK